MNQNTHRVLQALLTFGQMALATLQLPDPWHAIAHAAVSALQGFLANYAHGKNPDGTPATEAYEPKSNGGLFSRKGR
jgi:hypothetical protein